jgi:hypothetical protein
MPEEEEDNRPVTVALLAKIFDARMGLVEARFSAIETNFEAALDSRILGLRGEV